ncbi:C1 family peptidase [Formosa undariae]|uniref:C1 family peptidase n=1 Tax=Formosa undariae TaxID=1325436 RepID=A0ABV5F062_9FLAO
MKNQIFICIILTCLLASCATDFNDNLSVEQQNPIDYESTETQFTSEDGTVYFTGASNCTGDGSYVFDEDKVLEALVIPTTLPEVLDLSSFLPPIGDQGRQGSCVSWAATYYLKSFQEHLESGDLSYNPDNIMSPAYTYNQITMGTCEGTSFENTLDLLIDKGAISLESFPYSDSSCNIQPTGNQDLEAEPNKMSDYKYLSGDNMVLEMKTLLNNQTPVLISTFLDSEFGKTDENGLTKYQEHDVDYDVEGVCHAMLVVGYSNENNAFKVVNSWGQAWGDNGFVWIDYAAFDNVTDDTAGFRVISSAIVAYDL